MRLLVDLAHSVAFMTRLKVPARSLEEPLDFARSGWALPVSGLLVAAVGLVPALGIQWLAPDPLLVGIVFVATTIVITGALHEDGWADCADGLWGGHDRDGRLAIMRRSDIGTYGTLALIVVFALQAVCVARLMQAHSYETLLLAFVCGRLAMIVHWRALKDARAGDERSSLSQRFGRPEAAVVWGWAGIIATVCALLTLTGIGIGALAGAAAAAVACWGATVIASAKIGGRTGDTLGATVIASQSGFLLGAAVAIGGV